jgi:Protein of unknown function (DUF3592)
MAPETYIIGTVTALALVALVTLARRSRRARDRQSSQWPRVEGKVLEVWQDGMGSFCVRYQFTPRGAALPITREEVAGCLQATLPAVGERVPVRYDPEAPMRARMQREGC